jgi:drug/metabolite transporter (DMT)-like permease
LPRSRAFQTYLLLLLFISLKALGNLALAWGTKHFPQHLAGNPALYLMAMLEPFVAVGIAMQILALLTRMALLSRADLSFVLPVTAVGYVLSTLLGILVLGENVTTSGWVGTFLIFAGAAVVGSSPSQSEPERAPSEADAAR